MIKFFKPGSPMVNSALLLFAVGSYTKIEDVPDLFDLREVVAQELEELK